MFKMLLLAIAVAATPQKKKKKAPATASVVDAGTKTEEKAAAVQKAELKGSAKIIGFGPARQITLNNDGDDDWTKCELRLPTNQHYMLQRLEKGDHESIVLPKFKQDGPEYDKPLDQITVTCEQGAGTFSM